MVTTFLPYKDFESSLRSLDDARLGKQRVEAKQILNALENPTKGYSSHPATKMWIGYENALRFYYNLCIDEWCRRGRKNNMEKIEVEGDIIYPWYIGWEPFHYSHQASLIRKHPAFYGPKFQCPEYYLERGYIWPSHHDESVLSIPQEQYDTAFTGNKPLFAPINKDTMKNAALSAKRMYTVVKLRELCRERGIRGYSKKKKDELFELLGLKFEF